jgi:hypothetical protein
MTVNEGPCSAGLLDEYDAAAATGELEKINRVLAKVGLWQGSTGMNWSLDSDGAAE